MLSSWLLPFWVSVHVHRALGAADRGGRQEVGDGRDAHGSPCQMPCRPEPNHHDPGQQGLWYPPHLAAEPSRKLSV